MIRYTEGYHEKCGGRRRQNLSVTHIFEECQIFACLLSLILTDAEPVVYGWLGDVPSSFCLDKGCNESSSFTTRGAICRRKGRMALAGIPIAILSYGEEKDRGVFITVTFAARGLVRRRYSFLLARKGSISAFSWWECSPLPACFRPGLKAACVEAPARDDLLTPACCAGSIPTR